MKRSIMVDKQKMRVEHQGISLAPIDGNLMLLPVRRGEARLVWNFQTGRMYGLMRPGARVVLGAAGALYLRVLRLHACIAHT